MLVKWIIRTLTQWRDKRKTVQRGDLESMISIDWICNGRTRLVPDCFFDCRIKVTCFQNYKKVERGRATARKIKLIHWDKRWICGIFWGASCRAGPANSMQWCSLATEPRKTNWWGMFVYWEELTSLYRGRQKGSPYNTPIKRQHCNWLVSMPVSLDHPLTDHIPPAVLEVRGR